MRTFASYDDYSTTDHGSSHHHRKSSESQDNIELAHLAAWFIVPIVAYFLIRFLLGNRRGRRPTFWGHVLGMIIYAAVAFVVWHSIRGQ